MNLLEGVSVFNDILHGRDNCKTSKTEKKDLIYNSTRYNNGIQKIKDKAEKLHKKGRDPVKTGIINPNVRNRGSNRKSVIEHYGNVSDSEFSDVASQSDKSVISISNDPNFMVNQQSKFLDNRAFERKFVNKENTNDTFLNQFEPQRFDMKNIPGSSNAVHKSSSNTDRLQIERGLALAGGYSNFGDDANMTYGIVPENQLIHNNMIPQFKGKTYGSDMLAQEQRNDVFQRRMETFTGNVRDVKIPKTEQKPLFSPLIGVTNIYGMPSVTELIEDRYNPSRERRNELPFRQERVTKGVNLGYNEVNKFGNDYRPLPKTIDELRTKDKQQRTYTMGVVEGSKGTKGPVIGETKKYKPERTKYWGDDRLVPSLGYIRAPAIYGEVQKENLATQNRGAKENIFYGAAKSEIQQATSDNVREKYKTADRENFKQAEPRNIILVEGLQAREDSNKYIPDPTQRSMNQTYTGPLGTSQINKGVAFDMISNIFDLTKRNLNDKYDRTGAAVTGDIGKTKAIDFNDIVSQTLRGIQNKYDRTGAAVSGDMGKTKAVDFTDIVSQTLRGIQNKYDRNGAAVIGDMAKGVAIDFADVLDPTLRDIVSKFDRAGAGAVGDYLKPKFYDPNDITKTTMRNIHDKYERYGVEHVGAYGKSYVFNQENNIPDPTMRNVHEKTDRAGGGMNGDRGNGYTINYLDSTPDPTMRNIHEKTDRAAGGMNGDRGNGYTINYLDATPDPTMRNVHEKTDRAGAGMNGDRNQGYTINYLDATPDPTMRNVHEKTDRAAGGMKGDRNEAYTINYTDATPDPTMRNIHEKTDRAAAGMNGDRNQAYTINYTDATPDPTMRTIHEKTDRAGHVTGDQNKGYQINYINYTPDPTMRDIHGKLNRSAAGANGVYLATRTRDDAKNMLVNTQKEKISKGRMPTLSGDSRGPHMDFTTVSLCEPIQINRDLMSSTISINDTLPFTLTKSPQNTKLVRNIRINNYVKDNLDGNPYINNIIHKSV
jgi:hypothetical protein